MNELNKVLVRQIKRHLSQPDLIPLELQPLIEAVSRAYEQYEKDRVQMEHSMDLNFQELSEGNRDLQQRIEQLERENAELRRFVSVASQDLREPVRIIVGFFQLLERSDGDVLSDKGRDHLRRGKDEARKLDSILEGLLMYSRIERSDLTPITVDMRQLLREVHSNLESRISHTGTTFKFNTLPKVKGDRSQLIRLFENLIDNSIKFRADDPPVISIENQEADEGFIRFTITDNGMGIDRAFKDRMFSLFQRLNRRGQYDGAGIGLAVCKKIVERHGGEIWIDPAYSDGLRVHFLLPACAPEELSEEDLPDPFSRGTNVFARTEPEGDSQALATDLPVAFIPLISSGKTETGRSPMETSATPTCPESLNQTQPLYLDESVFPDPQEQVEANTEPEPEPEPFVTGPAENEGFYPKARPLEQPTPEEKPAAPTQIAVPNPGSEAHIPATIFSEVTESVRVQEPPQPESASPPQTSPPAEATAAPETPQWNPTVLAMPEEPQAAPTQSPPASPVPPSPSPVKPAGAGMESREIQMGTPVPGNDAANWPSKLPMRPKIETVRIKAKATPAYYPPKDDAEA